MARRKRQRWYDAQGQKRMHTGALEKSSGLRRVLSLVVLLVMVLILIQQTSDVKKVEKVATAVGLLPNKKTVAVIPFEVDSDSTSGTTSGTTPMPTSSSGVPTKTPDPKVDAATLEQIALRTASPEVRKYQLIWSELFKKATEPVVFAVACKLYGHSASERIRDVVDWSAVPGWFTEAESRLDIWMQIEAQNSSEEVATKEFYTGFQAMKLWFISQAERTDGTEQGGPTLSGDMLRGLKLAVDQELLDRIVDNSTWKSTERIPFARSWQRVDSLRELMANKLVFSRHFSKREASQLLFGGQSYRGHPMRFDGTIYRVDPITTFSEEGFGDCEYHVIWLKPAETSIQPVCVYIPIANVDPSVKLATDSQISVTGLFFKRIAYASQRGSDVAPLLLAAYVKPMGAEETDGAGTFEPTVNPFSAMKNVTPERKAWQPPVDTATPYLMVSTSMQRALSLMNEEILAEGFRGSTVSEAMQPLLEWERLTPEIDLLLSGRSEWHISPLATISRLAGMVNKVERIAIASSLPQFQDSSHVYRCQMEIGEVRMVLLCNSVPSAWLMLDGAPVKELRQPCVVDVLKLTQSDGSIVAWARSTRWKLLDTATALETSGYLPSLSGPLRFLLAHGWDLAWVDVIREMESEQIRPLSSRELEPYYRLMQLANQTPYELKEPNNVQLEKSITVPELIETFRQKKKGDMPAMERVAMNLRIVRVSRIQVEVPKEAAMLGSGHYYQLDAMADIGNRTYEIKGENDPIVYHKEYPVTCVVIELPAWLRSTDSSSNYDATMGDGQVWYPRTKASASGWFYRFWSYKTQETSQSLGGNRKQIGPLIVLDHLDLGFVQIDDDNGIGERTASNLAVVIGVLGTLGIWWFVRRSTKRVARN